MCVVSVPLDIDDTLRCFKESLAKTPHALRSFQHSRTLLMLLLADTQRCKPPSLSCTPSAFELGLESISRLVAFFYIRHSFKKKAGC